jgi:hypothetical protein
MYKKKHAENFILLFQTKDTHFYKQKGQADTSVNAAHRLIQNDSCKKKIYINL